MCVWVGYRTELPNGFDWKFILLFWFTSGAYKSLCATAYIILFAIHLLETRIYHPIDTERCDRRHTKGADIVHSIYEQIYAGTRLTETTIVHSGFRHRSVCSDKVVSIILWVNLNIDILPRRRCINISIEFIEWPHAVGYRINSISAPASLFFISVVWSPGWLTLFSTMFAHHKCHHHACSMSVRIDHSLKWNFVSARAGLSDQKQ